jgi:hypothetical protein
MLVSLFVVPEDALQILDGLASGCRSDAITAFLRLAELSQRERTLL